MSFSEQLNFLYLSKPFYRWVPNDVFLFDWNAFRSTIVSMLCERKIMQIEFLIKVKSFAVHPHTALFLQICFTGKLFKYVAILQLSGPENKKCSPWKVFLEHKKVREKNYANWIFDRGEKFCSTSSHCTFSSNLFHGLITQIAINQLSDPENKKCSPWKVFGTIHPQTLQLLSRRGPRSPKARLSQHYVGLKMTFQHFSKFCRKKFPGLTKRLLNIFIQFWGL